MQQAIPQTSSTFKREGEAEALNANKPFPPKAKRLAIIFSVILLALVGLPLMLEASGTPVRIGPWLSMLITLPIALFAMVMMGFLRNGMALNIVSGAGVVFAATLAYGLEFEPGQEARALLFRGTGLAVVVVLLGFFWLTLKKNLRDLHYMIAEGESMQEIMHRAQQANIIRKAGGEPVMDDKGNVVDKRELVPQAGFRQKRKKTARQQGQKKKRKKPKVR